jgi:hypothetical protein
MLAILLAALVAASPRYDTIFTHDGSRLAGTVVEESPTRGVTIQLPDGTLRRFDPGTVVRIEFSDGSVSNWEPPKPAPQPVPVPPPEPPRPAVEPAPAPPPPSAQQPAPAPAPAPAPQPAPAAAPPRAPPVSGPLDTVFLVGGGRVRGRVIEELPGEGVTLVIPDGTTRRYAPEQVARVEYADGTVSRRRELRTTRPPPPRSPPPPYGPPSYGPPSYPPPSPPPPRAQPVEEPPPFTPRRGAPPVLPVYAALGLGGAGFGGDLRDTVAARDVLEPQIELLLEGGIRLSPAVALGLYLDVGAGDPADAIRASAECRGTLLDGDAPGCVAATGRFGILLRHTWDHSTPTSKWLAVGTGVSALTVSRDDDATGDDDLYTYTGREILRLMAGVDLRSNPVFGLGFYGGVSWNRFTRFEDATGRSSIPDRDYHAMYEAGLRVVLFP